MGGTTGWKASAQIVVATIRMDIHLVGLPDPGFEHRVGIGIGFRRVMSRGVVSPSSSPLNEWKNHCQFDSATRSPFSEVSMAFSTRQPFPLKQPMSHVHRKSSSRVRRAARSYAPTGLYVCKDHIARLLTNHVDRCHNKKPWDAWENRCVHHP